jgi:ligand-binding sensor domain-containing protein
MKPAPTGRMTLEIPAVWSMIKASDNTMWFATNQGLFYYDPVSLQGSFN